MFRITPLLAIPLLLLLGGCPAEEAKDVPAQTPGCGAPGNPCALMNVAGDVLQRGEDLSVAMRTMLEGGASAADALAFVAGQDGVAEAAASELAVRFRLAGGRDCWVLAPEALGIDFAALPAEKSEVALPAVQKSAQPPAVPMPRGRVADSARDASGDGRKTSAARVVGDDPEAKSALILAPFEYQFRVHDDGAAVARILEATRGYEGRVTYLENSSKDAKTVGIEQFKGWDAYDVVLVTGHGSSMCVDGYCMNVILTGDTYTSAAELAGITDPGVNTIHIAGVDRGQLALSPDFFRHHYGAGLENTIIFFNACKSYGAGPNDGGSLSNALLGPGSVYLGWSEVVHADVAYSASVSLFQSLADQGVTAWSALDQLGDRAIDRYTRKNGEAVEAWLLLDRPADGDLRAREVITLEYPGGGDLTSDAQVRVIGEALDGKVDRVPFQVLVEGIEEWEAEFATVVATVEGHDSDPIAVSSGERAGPREYRVRGEIEYVDVAPEQTVEMRAEVRLPEGGTSEHTLTTNLTAEQGPETWTGEATSSLQIILGGGGVVNVSAVVTLQQTEHSIGKPTKRLKVTGGTMYWSRTGTVSRFLDGDCSYSAGPIEVPIQPEDGEIIIDTTTSPPTYTMHGFTNGPTVRCAENCGDYAFSTSADGVWIPAITDYGQFFVTPDGAHIEGSTAEDHRTWTWSFRRQ
ncbi:MAG: hypothetical protein CHACPFDD_02896 [Phycisphaerae bacterium]|nr:hypothetical protein [Phycisphaerae bacterium]